MSGPDDLHDIGADRGPAGGRWKRGLRRRSRWQQHPDVDVSGAVGRQGHLKSPAVATRQRARERVRLRQRHVPEAKSSPVGDAVQAGVELRRRLARRQQKSL
jgi:hypothetical protein